ncbi:MAG: GIY-YIG nuclease family protein [Selenomonadaceae bacterium]|nr:GIY-YIG nuclease family protein [Selenomonadaceae bacterium]
MEVYGVVYLILNTINGKMYVGQTKHTVEERFNQHAYVKTAIGNAIHKYGKKNFRYCVIKCCASKADMDYWEKFFIILLGSKYPNGYNLT